MERIPVDGLTLGVSTYEDGPPVVLVGGTGMPPVA